MKSTEQMFSCEMSRLGGSQPFVSRFCHYEKAAVACRKIKVWIYYTIQWSIFAFILYLSACVILYDFLNWKSQIILLENELIRSNFANNIVYWADLNISIKTFAKILGKNPKHP